MKTLKFLLVFCPAFIFSQEITPMTGLSNVISESSGLYYLDGRVITHNDSGGLPRLYELDTLNGDVVRIVSISNAMNIDWECITHDTHYLYIGDIGNNDGSRTDLRFYRVALIDYYTSNIVEADTILFKYEDQIHFSPNLYTTNFDAEASVVLNDSIYIFTKNWGDNMSNVYSIPTIPGEYIANKVANLDVQGLVTDATYNSYINRILMTGYTTAMTPFVKEVKVNYAMDGSLSFSLKNHPFPIIAAGYANQIEGVCNVSATEYYLSSEKFGGFDGALYSLTMPMPTPESDHVAEIGALEKKMVSVFPNPGSETVYISTNQANDIVIYSSKGSEVWNCNDCKQDNVAVDVSNWSKGTYMISFNYPNEVISKKLIIE